MTGAYIIERDYGDGISMDSGRILRTVRALVKFDEDGVIAHYGTRYTDGHEPRNMMAVAGKMRLRYQAYFERTGKRFEIEERDRKKAERDAKAAEATARKAVREAAPELLEALRIARRIVAKAVTAGTEPDNALRTIDAALAKALPQ